MARSFTKLTRDAVKQLKPGARITEAGITAERLANRDLRWTINVMVEGQRIHRVIGLESENKTRTQAEDAIAAFRTKAREDRLDLPTGRKTHRTFAEAAEEYLAQIEPDKERHGRNIVRKRHHMNQRLIPYFRDQRPDKLTEFGIANYRRHREREGASQATINREVATLSHFLNRCIAWKWIKQKVAIPRAEEKRKQIETLDAKQKAALMKAAIGDQDPFTWLFVAIAMGAAMRHSEILRVRWEQIDFNQRRINIPEAKAGQRVQPIPASLAETLRKQWEQLGKPSGYLFPTERADAKSPHRTTMAPQFRRAVKRAGMNPEKVTPHILRHTAITELIKAGVDLPTVQKISGHKTFQMVLHYTTLEDDHVSASVDNLAVPMPDTVTQELQKPEGEGEKTAA